MSNNVLQKIIDKKKLKLEKIKNEISLESINDQIEKNNNFIDFKNKNEHHSQIRNGRPPHFRGMSALAVAFPKYKL